MIDFSLDYDTPVDTALQEWVETIDAKLRQTHGIAPGQTAMGVLDLKALRLAMLHPDRIEYAASVPKIGILLAYFQLHPEAADDLTSQTRHELGLMIKSSSNEAATKFSRAMGLRQIQQVLDSYDLYNASHGGGVWVGKHYGLDGERIGDPLGNHSHAATVRQLLRFYLWLEQGRLVSPVASRTMREVFESAAIPHDNIKFVKALAPRQAQIIRKWGSWEDWLHDSAVVSATDRYYILVGLTHHPEGDSYLFDLAKAVDDLLSPQGKATAR